MRGVIEMMSEVNERQSRVNIRLTRDEMNYYQACLKQYNQMRKLQGIAPVSLQNFFRLIAEKQNKINRAAAVHVLAQGSRSPECKLNKLPTELLGKIAACFFNSTEHKLTSQIKELNSSKRVSLSESKLEIEVSTFHRSSTN